MANYQFLFDINSKTKERAKKEAETLLKILEKYFPLVRDMDIDIVSEEEIKKYIPTEGNNDSDFFTYYGVYNDENNRFSSYKGTINEIELFVVAWDEAKAAYTSNAYGLKGCS